MNIRYYQKDPAGPWWLDIRAKGYPRKRVATGTADRAEAERLAPGLVAKAIAALSPPNSPNSATVPGVPAKPKGPTLKEAFNLAMTNREGWIESKDKVTIKGTYKNLGLPDELPVAALTRDFVRDLRAKWLKEPGKREGTTLSHSTINQRLSMLSVLLDAADLPPHTVKHLSTKGTRRTRRIPQREITAMQSWCFANSRLTGALVLADLITVALETCAREDELLSLLPGDIRDDTATFRDTKNGETRTVPLPEASRRILEARKHIADGPFSELTLSQLGSLWRQMREALGLEADHEFVFHTLRHEGISRLVDAGVNAFTIQAIAGHSNITTTQIYAKASAEAMREAQAAVAQRAMLQAAQPQGGVQ